MTIDLSVMPDAGREVRGDGNDAVERAAAALSATGTFKVSSRTSDSVILNGPGAIPLNKRDGAQLQSVGRLTLRASREHRGGIDARAELDGIDGLRRMLLVLILATDVPMAVVMGLFVGRDNPWLAAGLIAAVFAVSAVVVLLAPRLTAAGVKRALANAIARGAVGVDTSLSGNASSAPTPVT